MKFLKLIPIIFIFLGIFPSPNFVYADNEEPNTFKILSKNNENLSVKNVQNFLDEGDALIKNGDFEKAKKKYDKARNLAKQLSGFYRDLNNSFRGLDARIPSEMEEKGRKSIQVWAEANARLAALYKRKKQPEVAVPLLVEIIRLVSPSSTEGKEAYQNLIQLGFADTPYRGF